MNTQLLDPEPGRMQALEKAACILEAGGGDAAIRARLRQALSTGGAVEGVAAGAGTARTGRSGRVAEVGAYVGATLVIAAGVVFLSTLYPQLGRAGVGACVLAISMLLGLISAAAQTGGGPGDEASAGQQARRRLTGIAGYPAALGLGVGTALLSGFDAQAATVTGAIMIAGGALLRARTLSWDSPSAQVWGIAASGVALGSGTGLMPGHHAALLGGAGVYVLGAAWTVWGVSSRTRAHDLACALGLTAMLIGGEITVSERAGLGYLMLAAAAVMGLAIDSRRRCTAALGLGVAATTIVVPQAVSHYTHGSLGAAGALLVGGLALLAASGLGSGLRRRRTVSTLA